MALIQTKHTEKLVLYKPNRPNYEFWPDQPHRNMGIDQTKQTNLWVLDRSKVQKKGIGLTKQTTTWVMIRQTRTKYGFWTDRTVGNMGNNQTDHIRIWVLAIPNRPKHGYWLDQADQNKVYGRTKQTKK